MKFLILLTAISPCLALNYEPKQSYLSQKDRDSTNVLKFLGGLGPYVDRTGFGIDRDPPAGCKVDQVIMMHRHGARYPEPKDGKIYEATVKKVRDANLPQTGSLAFIKDWKFMVENEAWYNLETFTGPYNGLADAFKRGAEYRERYRHLWDGQTKVPIFTAAFHRIVQTAREFGQGFLQFNYTDSAAVQLISEHNDQGADSLTPQCVGIFKNEKCNITANKPEQVNPQAKVAAARLNDEYKDYNLNLTGYDVHKLMQVGSFEFNVRSWSPWVDVFTRDEWVGFEYVQDMFYYYCSGPGAEFSLPMGSVYANATLQLMKQGPEKAGSMFWTFSHDTNITPNLYASGLLAPHNLDLPLNGTIAFYDQYRATDIVPMSSHFVLERLSCDETPISKKGVYVRAVLNEAVIPWPKCQDGPGFSCSLDEYEKIVVANQRSFVKECKIPKEWPQHLKFFWDWRDSDEDNFLDGKVPYQYGMY